MKVALCCIGKNENRYIREYVDHYRTVGVDKIFLFDNNDPDGERFEEVIQPEIDSGFVEITDYRGKKVCQLRAYQECYDKHGVEYDWICFFDCDEFWWSYKFGGIKDFLKQPKFDSFDIVRVNWLSFGDNEQLRYEDKPLKERFGNPLPFNTTAAFKKQNIPENFHIKSCIRGGRVVYWLNTPHTPYPSVHLKSCNVLGTESRTESPLEPFVDGRFFLLQESHLKHYSTKTAEEYARKMLRGFPDQKIDNEVRKNLIETRFFSLNKRAKDKEEIINKVLNGEL